MHLTATYICSVPVKCVALTDFGKKYIEVGIGPYGFALVYLHDLPVMLQPIQTLNNSLMTIQMPPELHGYSGRACYAFIVMI